MAKKTGRKTAKPLTTGDPVETAHLVQQDLEEQPQQLKRETEVIADVSNAPPGEAVDPPAPAAAKSSAPLAALGDLWPDSGLPEPARMPPRPSAPPTQAAVPTPAPHAMSPPVAPAAKLVAPASAAKPFEKSVPIAKTGKPAGAGRAKASFVLFEPNARQVSLSGDFNGWSREQTPMTRRTDGSWEASLALAPGRYEYKFIVDGQWIPDPLAAEQAWNAHGSLNSVIRVPA